MSKSNPSFGEGFKTNFLPIALVFFGFIIAGTCLSTGPFIPVGLAGLVGLATIVYLCIKVAKDKRTICSLQTALEKVKDDYAADTAKVKELFSKKDAIINDQTQTIESLMNSLAKVKQEIEKKKEVKEEVKEEPKKEEKKPAKKQTKK